jgi:EAL domain-containing protein (putative c-di-GMP-specific phosphodiesterase class I)
MTPAHASAVALTCPPPYGERAGSLLARSWGLLEPQVHRSVRRFYATLSGRPEHRAILDRLTPAEYDDFTGRQGAHLRALLDPDADPCEMAERSRQVGRVHAMVGVELAAYVEAVRDYQRDLLDAVDASAAAQDRAPLRAVVTGRLDDDLHAVLLGYRDVDTDQSTTMMRVTRVIAEARTVTDLAHGVLDAMSGLDGITVGFFGRPDQDGRVQFEMGGGDGVDAFTGDAVTGSPPPVTSSRSEPNGRGPVGRAWRSGVIQRSDSYLTDPSTALWRSLGERYGWRSCVAVPLADEHGAPRAVLSFYSPWPGYFAHPTRTAMLEQVKDVGERALAVLESRPSLASGFSRYVERTAHVARLEAGEVEMLFQPVIDLPTGRLSKLEALARLVDGDRLVTPGEFLPAFGDDELVRLFEIGVDQSLSALRTWEAAGVTTDVSVNLPVISAQDDRYVTAVERALADSGIAPQRLTLELLETGHVDAELSRRRNVIDEFKDLGVRIAQDDLGSGYSSLLRLRHFPFDDVKIDKSLVRGTELAPRASLHFIQPITNIAHSLGLTVIVEGLETEGLIEAAVHLGVDAGQGFAIARPMRASAVLDWVAGYRLDVSPEHPRTSVGALAAHVAWEHRVTAVGRNPVRDQIIGIDNCPLTAYIAGCPERRLLTPSHEALHTAALSGRGGAVHRDTWQELAAMIGEG